MAKFSFLIAGNPLVVLPKIIFGRHRAYVIKKVLTIGWLSRATITKDDVAEKYDVVAEKYESVVPNFEFFG